MSNDLPPEPDKQSWQQLGWTFETEAELYDAFRPGYASNVFSRLVELTELRDEARILEIGAGTGQATVPMAKRGYDLTALEPGATLADLVRKKLQPHPNTSVITSKLEDAELPNESFDLVYSAMALHWVAEEMRFTKPHRLLRPDGHLAILSHEPVTDEAGDKFFHAFPPIANRYGWGLEEDDFERLPTPEEVYHIDRVPIDTELFEEVDRAVFALELEPRTGLEHALYMHTMASVLAMPERERLAFLGEIKSLIETELNDQLNYRHADMLVIARKK